MFILLVSSLATATINDEDQGVQVEYGQDVSITVEDGYDNSEDPLRTSEVWIEVCSADKAASISKGTTGNIDYPVELEFNTRGTDCGYGSKNAEVYASEDETGNEQLIGEAEINLTAPKSEPHRGDYISIKSNINANGESGRLHWFTLTDKAWGVLEVDGEAYPYTSDQEETRVTGYLLVAEHDSTSANNNAMYPTGKILTSTEDTLTTKGTLIDNPIASQPYEPEDSIIRCGRFGNLDTGHDENKLPGCGVVESALADGDGQNDPKAIVQKGFFQGTEWDPRSVTEYDFEVDETSPIHEDGEHTPQGSIVSAYNEKEDLLGSSDQDRKRFYVCREGLETSLDGFTVDMYPGSMSKQELYRCDTEGEGQTSEKEWRDNEQYDWEKVTQCQDGLDNNQNGNTDLEDVKCGNNPLTQFENPRECKPVIGIPEDESLNTRHAFNNTVADGKYSPESSTCEYDNITKEPPYTGQEPVYFQCLDSGGSGPDASAQNYDGPTPDAADNYCQNRLGLGDYEQNPMPAVQYFVPKSVMQLDSTWANESGYRPNYGFQTLHQAEVKYSEAGRAHSAEEWEEHDIQNLTGYEEDMPEDYIDAWNISNASGIYDNEVRYDLGEADTLASDDVFKGGFHGECNVAMNWTYSNGEWRCDTGPVSDVQIEVNPYILEGYLQEELAGFQIDWTQMQKWGNAHPSVTPEGGTGYQPVKVEAMCWWGGKNERPTDMDEVVNITETVEEGNVTHVIGKLPARESEPEFAGTYSCVYGMSQTVEADVIVTSSQTDLFFDGKEGAELMETGRLIGYITEGTEDILKGNVQTVTERIKPSPDMQSWLEERRSTEVDAELWENFRKTDEEQENRNPLQNCINRGTCTASGS